MNNYVNEKLNKFNEEIKNKRIAIIGMGVSNKPLIDYFYNHGAKVTAFDNREKDKIDSDIIASLDKANANYYFGANSLEHLVGFDYIFRSPSCRPDTPEIV